MSAKADPLEPQIDLLESQLRASLGAKHFDDRAKMEQALKKTFGQYDTSGDGRLQYEEFECALVRDLNFVGLHRVIRGLFERYDSDCSDRLSFPEFCGAVLGAKKRDVGNARNVVERVKNLIIARGGANGIRTMSVILRRMDRNGNKKLDEDELKEGLAVYGVHPSKEEMKTLMAYFDRDGDRSIGVTEFLRGVRGRMARRRVKLVRTAFGLLDKTADETITVEDLLQAYDTSQHPEVISGDASPDDILAQFLELWDKDRNGTVTWQEFLDYYKDISCGIDDDAYFELMMRNAWHISGGEGVAANTTCIRVLVTHSDGSQTVEEVKNDLGIRFGDLKAVTARLNSQGITDIKEVSFS